jgi:hypothetical protein
MKYIDRIITNSQLSQLRINNKQTKGNVDLGTL